MSFEKFVDIVINKRLTFVKPLLWDDPYETFLYDNFSSELVGDENYNYFLKCHLLNSNLFAMSWTTLSESDAMWRIYNTNNSSVKIKVSTENLKLLGNVQQKNIRYIDKYDFDVDLKDMTELYSYKRKAFEHEEEVRLFYSCPNSFNPELNLFDLLKIEHNIKFRELLFEKMDIVDDFKAQQIILDYTKNYLNKCYKIIDKRNYINLELEDVSKFIESVQLSPFAPGWFVETFEKFCLKHNIRSEGKSNLYINNKI